MCPDCGEQIDPKDPWDYGLAMDNDKEWRYITYFTCPKCGRDLASIHYFILEYVDVGPVEYPSGHIRLDHPATFRHGRGWKKE